MLGAAINNLDKLIQMPFGCGEQNMLNFVSNIVVIKYLTNTEQLTKIVENKALTYMETGYQRELTYKRQNGSFSAFGNNDDFGSTWLTAFVAKSLNQAAPFITVDKQVLADCLSYLTVFQVTEPNKYFVIHLF